MRLYFIQSHIYNFNAHFYPLYLGEIVQIHTEDGEKVNIQTHVRRSQNYYRAETVARHYLVPTRCILKNSCCLFTEQNKKQEQKRK